MMSFSPFHAPITCSDNGTGCSPLLRATGRDSAGSPAREDGIVMTSLRYNDTGLAGESIGKAPVGVVGVKIAWTLEGNSRMGN